MNVTRVRFVSTTPEQDRTVHARLPVQVALVPGAVLSVATLHRLSSTVNVSLLTMGVGQLAVINVLTRLLVQTAHVHPLGVVGE